MEQIESSAFGTLGEHVASHDYPVYAAMCGPCKFWKNRWRWGVESPHNDPESQKQKKHGLGAIKVVVFA